MKRLLLTLLILFFTNSAYSATEDFTTFTEVDELGEITVTASSITLAFARQDQTSSVYKDYTSDHFGEFEHIIKTTLTQADASNFTRCGVWAISDSITPTHVRMGASNDAIGVHWLMTTGPVYRLRMINYIDADNTDTSSNLSISTAYWLEVERTASAMNLRIYSDEARTTLVDTVTVTYNGQLMQYLSAGFSQDNAAAFTDDLKCLNENLDLQEGAAATRRVMLIQ